jgi:hypothetical protein
MWQTVTEVNGTNAYDQADPWHEKVNDYFVMNDPYRHPTTASGSGEVDWSTGHAVMDMPQVHLYEFDNSGSEPDAVASAAHVADWTQTMLKNADKPNWVGEFGVTGNSHYPELFHNSIWAALATGASMTPAEWNSGGSWGRMTPEMNEDMSRFANFVRDLPHARWKPSVLQIESNDEQVRAWGIAGDDGGLFWVQDFSLEGTSIDEVRSSMLQRAGVRVEIKDIPPGTYLVSPYDTWQGDYLDPFEAECAGDICVIDLPDFKSDMVFKLLRQ